MEFLSVRKNEDIAYVTLQNPREFNALSLKLLQELDSFLQQVAEKREVKVVVIEGSTKAFCSGHSLREIENMSAHEVLKLFQTCQLLMRRIREIPQIVISKVEGAAVAAGCQLVAISDMAVASENARFGTPGINSGLFCSTPAVFLSRNIGRKKAAEMLFTGNLISAREALELGLVNKVVPPNMLDEETEKLAKDVTKQSLNIIEIGKRMFYQQLNMEDFQALNYATEVIALNSKHPDAVEGIRAFFEKRTPVWNDKLTTRI
ncbi:enoyl-CoA hydratase/isomerase family protein [Parageobacillus sp. VR-IP]|uniref:enoyl-CoA hydratase-related protein n=1 Tax=Parageobacillus sp. VR-IP TaxID=2742205 RepID=UPI001583F27A|nr:enoyl-CoA hydratase-related protein [Parageobacillus sp. VR-IP]NUK29385.1 enoyl-CoA hydratase/isomerase family protein [Parageobacillus sp. VR-IP]